MDRSTAAAWTEAGDRRDTPGRPRAEFRLLGHLEVGDGDGAQAFGGPKQRALLAFLLLHAGEVVTTERLVDAIWGDEPPPTATAIVYGYVRKLRSGLDETSATLSTRSSGYVLDIPGGSLDVAQFERLSGLGRQALRAGDATDARRLLGSALALWRGQALDGLEGEGFIHAEQSRLESLRLATLLGRIDSDLRLGGAAEVVEELAALAREHPLDEGIRGQLMVALYRTGNQAEALAAYQDIRRALAEELGLDPSRSLQELEGAILRQDPSLDPLRPGADPRPIAAATRTTPVLHLVESTDACPFVGLATFGVHDADVFFGRERLVSEMVARLGEHGFLGVVGPSGSGKSSAVRAGLVPAVEGGALGDTSWVRVILRPGSEPLRELDRVVFAALDESQRSRLPAGADPLAAAASVLPEGSRLLVIVDQFEEAFTSVADGGARAAFIATLVGAARAGTAAVVLALRADFYGRCAEEPALAEQLATSQVLVGPMGRDEYRSVIEGPAGRAGLSVEPALVERLIDEVEGRPGGLPLLSTALVELWERRDGRTIPLSALAATGGVSGAVGRLAENAYGQLTDAEQASARIAFLRLVGGEGEAMARRRVPLAEFDIASNPDVQRTLTVLTAARLLTADRGTVEVAHEALFREWPRLEGWLDEDRQGRRVRAHLTDAARDWDERGRPPAELYRGARLAAAQDWSADHADEVNDLERQFVAESQAVGQAEERRQRRANRRLRLLLVGAAAGLVLAIAASAVALTQRAAADAQTLLAEHAVDTADAERLGAEGLGAKDLDVALLLARQGVAVEDSAATRANLLATLDRSPAATRVSRPLGGRPQAIVGSPDGTTLLVVNNEGQVAVIDAATDATRYIYDVPDDFHGAYLADNNDVIVIRDGPSLTLLDPMTDTTVGNIAYPPGPDAFSWAPDLKTIGRLSDDRRSLTIYDATTQAPVRTLSAPPGTWLLDLTMLDGGTVLAPLIAGDVPSDPFAPWDQPGAIRVAVWGPGDTVPVVSADQSTSATRSDAWRGGGMSPDHRMVLLTNTPGVGQGTLLDLRAGTQLPLKGGHSAMIMGGAFSPDGSLVATSGDDGATRLWDARTGSLVDTLSGHDGRVWAPAFSELGGQLILHTDSLDGTVITWDVTGSRRLGAPFRAGAGTDLPQGLAPKPQVAVSPDGRLLAVNDLDGFAILDATTHAVLRRLPQTGGSFGMTWSADGTRLAVTGVGTAAVDLYDTGTWQLVSPDGGPLVGSSSASTQTQPDVAWAAAFSPDSSQLVVGDDLGFVWSWDARTGARSAYALQVGGPVYDLAFDPTSGALAVAYSPAGAGGRAALFVPGATVASYIVDVDDAYGQPQAVAFDPDGTTLVTGGGTGDVRFWDAMTGAEIAPRVVTSAGWVLDLAWTPDGKTLVSTGTDGTVRLIDVASKTVTGTLPGLANEWVGATPSPDGSHLYVAYATGQAFDWAIDPEVWARDACAIAGRTLTKAEWAQYLPTRPYAPACTP